MHKCFGLILRKCAKVAQSSCSLQFQEKRDNHRVQKDITWFFSHCQACINNIIELFFLFSLQKMFIRGQTEFTSYLEIIKNGIYPVEQFKNIELLTNCQYIESLRLLLRLKRINLWEHRHKYIIVSEDFGCFESARSYRTNIRKDILIVEAYKHNGVFVISTTPSMSFK